MDISYIPIRRGFVYLATARHVDDRREISRRVSITMETAFCVEALEEELAKHGKPEIYNTDQGNQSTSFDFASVLLDAQVMISMDGKGAWRDNVFVKRLWRSVNYEEVYLRTYDTVSEAPWSRFYGDVPVTTEGPHRPLTLAPGTYGSRMQRLLWGRS